MTSRSSRFFSFRSVKWNWNSSQISIQVCAVVLSLVICSSLITAGCKAGSAGKIKTGDMAAGEKVVDGNAQPQTEVTRSKSESNEISSSSDQDDARPEGISKKSAIASTGANNKVASAEKPDERISRAPKPFTGLSAGAQAKDNKTSELDLIKRASLDIAKGIETVKKIRICYSKNQDEWWVTLYDDLGPILDLKQYVWDRDTETLRPFLVLKRLSKNRFESELNSKTPDRTCEILDPPAKTAEKKK